MFKDCEVIICNWNPDNDPYLRDLVENMAKCRYYEVNRPGIAYARHMGIMKSYGSIICNYDADCEYIHKNCLRQMVQPILNKECILTVCDNLIDVTDVPESEHMALQVPIHTFNLLNNTQKKTPMAIFEPGSCMSKEAYLNVGGFDDIKSAELWHLNNRFLYHYNSLYGLLKGGLHKQHIDTSGIIVSPRRVVKFQSEGIKILDYSNAYR